MSQRKRQREREQQTRQRKPPRRERDTIPKESSDDSGNTYSADLAESSETFEASAGHPNRRDPGDNNLRIPQTQSPHLRTGQQRDDIHGRRSPSLSQRDGPGGPRRDGPGGPRRDGPGGPRRDGPGYHRSGRHMPNSDHATTRSPRRFTDKNNASPANQTVKHIARVLGETQRNAIAQIRRIVTQFGEEFAQEMLATAWQVEKQGGMMTSDGNRRRTFGGVFFFLIKERLVAEGRLDELSIIFPHWRPKKQTPQEPDAAGEAPEPPQPPLPVATWADRGDLIAEIMSECGTLNSVKVTLVGKLAQAVERQGFILATMEYRGPLPALPKGIPVPDEVPAMTYVIYIGSKQWYKVKDALDNPEDAAIVEGTQFYDTDTNAIVVFATNFTTKLIEHAKREAQKASTGEQARALR